MTDDYNPAQEAIFREVDDDLRQENLKKIWDKYGILVIGAALSVVIIVAGYQMWGSYKTRVRTEDSVKYQTALNLLNNGMKQESAKVFDELSKNPRTGYGNLAYMHSAGSLNNAKDSVNTLQKMVADKNTDAVFRELAEIKQAMLLADSIEITQLKKRLKPYIEAGSPWRSSAMELVAGVMLRDGDVDGARKMFKQISEDALVTSGVRSRAAEMLIVLGKK